jgi:ATP-binding cassette subfamily B protein RtxE
LLTQPLPLIVPFQNSYLVLENQQDGIATVFDPRQQRVCHWPLETLLASFGGQVLLLARPLAIEAAADDQVEKLAFGFRWFIPSIKKYFHQFRDVLIASLVLQLIALVTPFLFQEVIDKVLVNRSMSSLQVLAVGLLGLALAEPLFGLARSIMFTHMASRVNSELSTKLYRHLLALPLEYFQKRQAGQIIARVREMDHIREFLTGSALTLVLDLFFVGIFLTVMFSYAAMLTWVVVISLVLYVLCWLVVSPALRERVQATFEQSAANMAFLTEAISGIETIKTSATEPMFTRVWQQKLAEHVKRSFRTTQLGLGAGQVIALIQKITMALILWFGVRAVLDGELTVGQLVAFNMLAGNVTMPILRLAQLWQNFQHTSISLKRLGDILDRPTEPQASAGRNGMLQLQGVIEFRNVRFRYNDDSSEVLKGIQITIQSEEVIGITGLSGSGKSTITKLIQRLYTPTSGQVLVDGCDLALMDPAILRRRTGVVLQESFLFNASIRANICLGNPSLTQEQVIHAAKLAGAHEFITGMPQGYESMVGEKGGNLSGGQRQRIAIARALVNDPRILVFDEATSALDYESESIIINNMTEICRGRTVIMIAHRLNSLRTCNRILVMEKGTILEEGTHLSLVESNGRYATLWQLQSQTL